MKLAIVLPKEGTHLRRAVPEGTAIVTLPFEGGRTECWYEGNIYDAVNLREFFERLTIAAHRLIDEAPTVAHESTPVDEIAVVAWFDTDTWSISEVLDEEALLSWTKEELHRLVGVKLDESVNPSWGDGARAAEKARHVDAGRSSEWHSFQTRAGQVLHFNMATKSVEIDRPTPAPTI